MIKMTTKRKAAPYFLGAFALLAFTAVTAVFNGGWVSAQSSQERDFFGTVVSVQGSRLVVTTKDGTREVLTDANTQVVTQRNTNAELADLAEGDLVAISLEERNGVLVADKIFLIPGKTEYRHVPGVVTALTDTAITIRPPAAGAEPITFVRNASTKVRFHEGKTQLAVGSFVVVLAARDPSTGGLMLVALEINVTEGKPPIKGEVPPAETDTPANTVEIRGVFQGIDSQGRWIISGRIVVVNADTEVGDGVAVGQLVEVEAVLLPDGSVVAVEVEVKQEGAKAAGSTRIVGVFQGVDTDTGAWIIGGTRVLVGPGTDTDGLPRLGQQVRVEAILQEDGSLLAREIENLGRAEVEEQAPKQVTLEGIFQGVDAQGNWTVNGTKVAVDSSTKLKGTPAVGQRVEVKAILRQDGSLLAREIKGEEAEPGKTKSEVKLHGTITAMTDRDIVVDGRKVVITPLTEIDGDLEVGQFVQVQAFLQEDGSLLAREIEIKGKGKAEVVSEPQRVEIDGTIQKVNPDGTLMVNGIKIIISSLTQIRGVLTVGASVEISGVMLRDGSVQAGQIKGEGRRDTASGTEVKIQGVIEAVQTDTQGRIVGVTVNGLTVRIEAVTRVEGSLKIGIKAEIQAVIDGGTFLATRIVGTHAETAAKPQDVKIQAIIEAVQTDTQGRILSVKVNGVVVNAVGARIQGQLVVGVWVQIQATIDAGKIQAISIERIKSRSEEAKEEKAKEEREQFKLEGAVQEVHRDAQGNLTSIVVGGKKIIVEALTRVSGTVEVGSQVKVEGIISGETFVASKIVGREESPSQEDRKSGGEGEKSGPAAGSSSDQSSTGKGDEHKGDGPGSGAGSSNDQSSTGKGDEDKGNGPGSGAGSSDERDGSKKDSPGSTSSEEKGKAKEFSLDGIIVAVNLSPSGKVSSVVVDGKTVVIEASTKLEVTVKVGQKVKISGVIRNDTLVATKIEND